jgi:hypothetical protein
MSNDNFSLAGYQPEQYADDTERYPLIYWLNSTKLGGVVGAWHTSSLSAAPAGWEQVERFDNEELAFETRVLTFVPLRHRMQWYLSLDDGSTKAIPHYMDAVAAKSFLAKHGEARQYAGVRSTTQMLAMVKGIAEPVVIQAKGLVAMKLFKRPTKRSGGGEVYLWINACTSLANQTKKGPDPIPHFAFWATLVTPLTAKGKPVTTEVSQGAVVVYPQLHNEPSKVTREELVRQFIGRDLLQLAHAMYLDGEAWANEPARDDFALGADAQPVASPAPSNVAQPLEDDDATPMPF